LRRDRVYGALILAAAIIGIVAYGWFLYSDPIVTLKVFSFIAVAAVLGIVGWMGWTMAKTPSPEQPEEKLPESGEGERKC